MTDISHPLTTQTAPHQLGPINALVTPTTSSTTSHDFIGIAQEDEPYTIKCICPYPDDDGLTVLCDQCGTWQHIECYYYPSYSVPEVHHCTDCGGAKYDTKAATERQKRKREHPEVEKPRRPASKSYKKKPRDQKQSTLQVDSWPSHDKQDALHPSDPKSAGPRDQPPAKKPKTARTNSGSMGSLIGIQSPSLGPSESRKVARAPPHATRSPSKSPPPVNSLIPEDNNEPYTSEFMQLYKHDPGDRDLPANGYSSIDFFNQSQSWLTDPAVLQRACGAMSPSDVFQRHQSIDLVPLPHISKRKKEDHRVEYHGCHPVWMYLTVDSFVPAGSLLGELKGGMVGHSDNYKDDGRNRWKTLRHPEPFVFFHPRLPMYIDARKEGTLLRYVRRSCRPNLEMKVLVTNNTEWHFCFVATEDILPDSELTIAWEYLPPIREYLDRHVDPDNFVRNGDFQSVAQWVNFLLANFGGCACENNAECVFARFNYRQNSVAPSEVSAMQTNGTKPRKQKRSKNHTPLEASRASSEGSRHLDHRDEHDDSRSTSGSVNSKSRSRDLTPATHFSGDVPSALAGTELSDREKRKIAAVEKSFERLDEGQGPKKKKRTSGGSNLNNSGVGIGAARPSHHGLPADQKYQKQYTNSGPPHSSTALPNTAPLVLRGGYAEASNGQMQSGSPTSDFPQRGPVLASPTKSSSMSTSLAGTPRVPSPVTRPSYLNASTQTDPEDDAWYSAPPVVLPRKKFIPYAQRLLERCLEDRSRFEMEKKRKSDAISTSNDALISPLETPLSILTRTGGYNLKQESEPLEVEERAANTDAARLPPPSMDSSPNSVMADSRLPDGVSRASPSSAIQPLDPNIQKTNTSNLAKADSVPEVSPQNAQSAPFKTTYPLPIGNSSSAEFFIPNPNAHRPVDLRLHLPPTPRLSDNSPATSLVQGTPSPATSSSLQPRSLNTNFAQSLIRNNTVQASPVKKKLSLSEYAQRKKVETPTTEKPQTRFGFEGPTPSHSSSGPSVPGSVLTPSLVEEAKASGGLN